MKTASTDSPIATLTQMDQEPPDRPPVTTTCSPAAPDPRSFQDIRDWMREEFHQLAEHFRHDRAQPANPPAAEYLSVKQAARFTSLSETRIRVAIVRHDLAASNMGSEQRPVYRIARVDLDQWLVSRRTGGGPLARNELNELVRKHLPGLFKKKTR